MHNILSIYAHTLRSFWIQSKAWILVMGGAAERSLLTGWQGKAQEQLPELWRKTSPPLIKFSRGCCEELPLPCLNSHPHTSVFSWGSVKNGYNKQPWEALRHPIIQTTPVHDEKPALLILARCGAGAPLKLGMAAWPQLLLAKADVFLFLCLSGSSKLVIRTGRWVAAWSDEGTWIFWFF